MALVGLIGNILMHDLVFGFCPHLKVFAAKSRHMLAESGVLQH